MRLKGEGLHGLGQYGFEKEVGGEGVNEEGESEEWLEWDVI